MLSWSFASDVGREGYAYDWSENVLLENAQPMSVLRHAGTNPLLLLAAKQQAMPVLAEMIEAVLDRAPEHLRNFIMIAEQDEEEKEVALSVLENGCRCSSMLTASLPKASSQPWKIASRYSPWLHNGLQRSWCPDCQPPASLSRCPKLQG
jgi:hypothetical protein